LIPRQTGGVGSQFPVYHSFVYQVGQRVKDLSFPNTTASSIKVTWIPSAQPHGHIQFYHIQANTTEASKQVKLTALTTETTFCDLEPNTKYKISVMTENQQVDGRGGGVGEAVTKEETTLPLSNLLSFFVSSLSNSSK
uniref:Fibronectin type-III domain-containing protein n=1 Tax=Schistocephalus solidus TaxID=70667 RepID=A0A183SBJ1_SCHSO